MTPEWQIFLYPLGFLAAIAFGTRNLLQWIESELAHTSYVSASYWIISLIGSVLILIHSFIQSQFHVFIIQGLNGVLYLRNLNLMQAPKKRVHFTTVCICFFIVILLSVLLFLFTPQEAWFRVPQAPWQKHTVTVSIFWHLFGFAGTLLFSLRFWVQWWEAEKVRKSFLSTHFFWISLIGALSSGIYFLSIRDLVNAIGPLLGLIPFARNLMLLYKTPKKK